MNEIKQLSDFNEGVNLYKTSDNKLLRFFDRLQYKDIDAIGTAFFVSVREDSASTDEDSVNGVMFIKESDMYGCQITNILTTHDEVFIEMLDWATETYRDIRFIAKTTRARKLLETRTDFHLVEDKDGKMIFQNYK